MTRKKAEPIDIVMQWRWERQCKAPLIRDKWPNVAGLTLEISYEDDQWPSHAPEARSIARGPEDKAFFDYGCPYKCRQGGFELTAVVSKMVEAGEAECSGESVCNGIGMSSGGPYTCRLKLKYRVLADYGQDLDRNEA